MAFLDDDYWSKRYQIGQTGWDIGYPSPPIVQYLDQFKNKDIKILIPGAGNAHEGSYAFEKGFRNIHLLDISIKAIENFKNKNPDFPSDQLHHQDFFLHEGTYDLIIEQTFFCAINPQKREDYLIKNKQLLKPKGSLLGVLFDREFHFKGPPFGGRLDDYLTLFEKYFSKGFISPCYNSIPERMGSELWIHWVNQ